MKRSLPAQKDLSRAAYQHMASQGLPSLSRSSRPPQEQFCKYQRAAEQLEIWLHVRREEHDNPDADAAVGCESGAGGTYAGSGLRVDVYCALTHP